MNIPSVFCLLLLAASTVLGGNTIRFNDWFLDRAMRIDFYLAGDAKDEIATIDRIRQEGLWPENPEHTIVPFENGKYTIKVYDVASNSLMYSRGFDCMFGEYRTTKPALKGAKRVYERSVRIPFPRYPFWLVLESRDRNNLSHPLFTEKIDPADVQIIKENPDAHDDVFSALKSGDPHRCVDLVFLAEGYTKNEEDKFKNDVDRFTGYLFDVEPYKTNRGKFNVNGVFRSSPESAMDEPRQGIFKRTILNASFNAFGLDRYMLTEENERIREIAAQVPYDAVVILVNSTRYGGGGMYNDYCITTTDHPSSKGVFVHEFGHSFAGLADEYYTSDVAYVDFYPKGVEPLEPNITALLDSTRVKWRDLISPGVRIPTEYGKAKLDSLQELKTRSTEASKTETAAAQRRGETEKKIKTIEEKYQKKSRAIEEQIQAVRAQYADLSDKVGVFEGAGYSSKGLYRPMAYCVMIYNPKGEFCRVCRRAIERMIEYYSAE